MRFSIYCAAVLTVCLPLSLAEAQDRVVVIPLNTGKATPDYGGVQVVTSTTGQIWMDRNIGALRSALNMQDPDAYGGLFQWGRLNDGHAWRSSSPTTTLSTTNTPGHGSFIMTSSVSYDWRAPQNDNLWQGVSGVNNPCPAGFRLPTEVEWEKERAFWSSNNFAGAFASPLKLVSAGSRDGTDGAPVFTGSVGYYWSSSVDGSYSRFMIFYNGSAGMFSGRRANGLSVRCLKD